MPIWLVTALTSLLEPIIEKLVAQLFLKLKLSSLANDEAKAIDGFTKLAAGGTDEERDQALDLISKSWNH